jgi:EmrB/QacA subfamily drug resistance transporter
VGTASWAIAERPPLRRVADHPRYHWLVIGTVCVGAFLGQLDASIAGLVLPTLEEVFHASTASVEWVAIAYLLTLAALVVPFGRLADLVGRKVMYSYGFLVFIAGSALCGAAHSLGWLVAFRVVQAIGAAMLQANSVAIIAAAARPGELGRAIGVQGAAQAVGLALGPTVGGLLISLAGWQWVFLIVVPIGLVGAAMGWLVLPQTSLRVRTGAAPVARERFDWLGTLLFAPAIAAGMLALTFGNTWGWASPPLLLSLAAAAAFALAFLVAEARVPYPLIDFALFRDRLFSAGVSAGLLSYGVLFGALFLLPFYVERILGHGPSVAGLLLSPIPIALGLVAPVAGTLTDRLGSRLPTVLGMALAAAGLLVVALVPLAPLPVVMAALAVLGLGLGLFTPPNNSAIMGSAPSHRLGIAGGILNMTRSLGTSLGVAATGLVLSSRLASHSGGVVHRTVDVGRAALLPGFRETLLFVASAALVGLFISLVRGAHAAPGPRGNASAQRPDEREAVIAAAEASGA